MRRIACVIAMLWISGCSQVDDPGSTGNSEQKAPFSTTPDDLVHVLVHVDAASADTQHPLVCGPGRDFSSGRELAFTNSESGEFVHAVFPQEVEAPAELDGEFVLHGRFQGIQNMANYTMKIPSEDYRYFVVSSWETSDAP